MSPPREAEADVAADAAAARDPAVRAAWLYYVEGLTQEAIAGAMGVSRAKVIRLLAAARDNGVVRIRIDGKGGEQIALERRLIGALGLAEAVVAPSPVDPAATAAIVKGLSMFLSSPARYSGCWSQECPVPA